MGEKPNGKPHDGGVALDAVRPRTATEWLATIAALLEADRGIDTPADETDYRDYPIGTAASTIYVDLDVQYQYVYIPNVPRDVELWTGTRSQYLGSWSAGAQINFRMPRETGLTINYAAGAAAATLSIYLSTRPIQINSVGSAASGYGVAIAAADNMANPTAPWGLSALMGWDGSTWDRARIANGNGGLSVNILGAGLSDAVTALSWNVSGTPSSMSTTSVIFNGTSYDRQRNNVEGTALASLARTASTQSADIINYNGNGVIIFIDVTAIAATPSIVVTIQEKDPVSGAYFDVLSSAAIIVTGRTKLSIHPGETVVANVSAAHALARTFRISVVNADADSITYSVGYCILSC